MKRLFMGFVMLFMLTGCSSNNSLQEINYDELKSKIENKESFVLYVSKTGCTYCEEYEPVLIEVLNDNKLEAYKVNLANMSEAEKNSVSKKVGLEGTPTLIYIENGISDIDGSLVGSNTYENTKDFFKTIGYIEG